MTLIKKAPSLKDPNLDRNQKHTTPNEIMNETQKRKRRKFKAPKKRMFISYADGQFEQIFQRKQD